MAFDFTPADFKLSDMLGIAGATIGIIIAGGILLGWLTSKHIDAFARFRSLADEYRGNDKSDSRKGNLRAELASYRRQILYLNLGTILVSLAILFFLITVSVASLSVVFPRALILRTVGTGTLLVGLLLIAVGVVLAIMESTLQRWTLSKEVADFDDIPSVSEALRH
jgi:uncharacterized BrkB/YihY/UPF0761 family membrane protein